MPTARHRARLKVRLVQHSAVAAVILTASLIVGIWGYWYFAGMPLLDGFLNSAMLLSGMGPVGGLETPASKVFAGCFALYAGIVFVTMAGFVMAPVIHYLLLKFRVEDA